LAADHPLTLSTGTQAALGKGAYPICPHSSR